MHVRKSSTVLPVLLVAALGVTGCGGSKKKDPQEELIKSLPKVKQNGVVPAKDALDANARCAAYQKKKPKLVTQIRFRIKGQPSQLCIVQ